MDTIVFGPLIIGRTAYCAAPFRFMCRECHTIIEAGEPCAKVRTFRAGLRLCPPCARALEVDA